MDPAVFFCAKQLAVGLRGNSFDRLQLYRTTPSRAVRSASDTIRPQITASRLFTVGSRAVSVLGPSVYME